MNYKSLIILKILKKFFNSKGFITFVPKFYFHETIEFNSYKFFHYYFFIDSLWRIQ